MLERGEKRVRICPASFDYLVRAYLTLIDDFQGC